MAGLAALASIAGTVVSAIGTIAAGKAQARAANYEAAQLDIKAKEERATAQRATLEKQREADLILSRHQALTAASGLGTTDPTVLDQAGEIAEYGTYQQQLEKYGGESRAMGLESQAYGSRMSGNARQRGATYDAFGTILGGVSTMFGRFAKAYVPTQGRRL
jgi:hypothetical protein